VPNTKTSSLCQITTVVAVFVGWFALSNHCVIGACARPVPVAKGCPMHAKSPEKTPKENGATQPCCKTLRAVMVVKIVAKSNALDFVLKPFFADTTRPVISQTVSGLLALDTGPPEALSFSESVLQRSILAHAPPHFI